MRKSIENLMGVSKDNYPELPIELNEFNYYFYDGETGHVIMAIPECFLDEAEKDGDLDEYECPVPVKYVLEKGYKIYKEHVICDVNYDINVGLIVDEKYFEI